MIPAHSLEQEIEVKKSRFIARALHVNSREDVLAAGEQAKRDHPEARHHCWAYLLGNPAAASNAGMNDAGEPSGTAGKPILNVIQHKGIGDVLVVVIRYFGGIKLGAGGLVRAYSGATEAVLSRLPLIEQRPTLDVVLTMGFAQEQMARHWLGQHKAFLESVDYGQQVSLQIRMDEADMDKLRSFCLAQGIGIRDEDMKGG